MCLVIKVHLAIIVGQLAEISAPTSVLYLDESVYILEYVYILIVFKTIEPISLAFLDTFNEKEETVCLLWIV